MKRLALVVGAVGLSLAVGSSGGAAATTKGPARLAVRATYTHVPRFVEGYVVRVRLRSDGILVHHREVMGPHHHLIRDVRLPRGSYHLKTALRPCDGNCSFLDPAWSRCDTRFHAHGGEAITIDVTERHPHCRMIGAIGVPTTG
jgi:hypothetical protein